MFSSLLNLLGTHQSQDQTLSSFSTFNIHQTDISLNQQESKEQETVLTSQTAQLKSLKLVSPEVFIMTCVALGSSLKSYVFVKTVGHRSEACYDLMATTAILS